MMRVVQLVDKLCAVGGVPNFVYDLCIALKDRGCDVIIIGILKTDKNFQPDFLLKKGIKVIELGAETKKQAILRFLPNLRKKLAQLSASESVILNMHLKLSVLMGCLASFGMTNIRRTETYHATYLHYRIQFFLLRSLIKKYITVSNAAKEELISKFHAPKGKVVAIPNGVDRDKLRSMVEDEFKCRKCVTILSVGRLSYQKNFCVSVGALSAICTPSIRYIVIGNGPELNNLKCLQNGNENIVFLGALPRQDVLHHLSSADLVIMPSLWEGRSILQLEAMAFDLPMIISDIPGLREPFGETALHRDELYRRCKFGYLVQTNNVDSYREAVKDFVKNYNSSNEMQNYIQGISTANDIKMVARKYIDEYSLLLKD